MIRSYFQRYALYKSKFCLLLLIYKSSVWLCLDYATLFVFCDHFTVLNTFCVFIYLFYFMTKDRSH